MNTPSLSIFLMHRRADLLKKIDAVRVEMAELERELTDIETAGRALKLSFDTISVADKETSASEVRHQEKIAPEMTMKEAALEVLREGTGGMTTNEILEVINDRLKTSYPRSSLSPQLSRLKGDGKVYREDGRWMLSGAQPA